jgi:hypothetical protein
VFPLKENPPPKPLVVDVEVWTGAATVGVNTGAAIVLAFKRPELVFKKPKLGLTVVAVLELRAEIPEVAELPNKDLFGSADGWLVPAVVVVVVPVLKLNVFAGVEPARLNPDDELGVVPLVWKPLVAVGFAGPVLEPNENEGVTV